MQLNSVINDDKISIKMKDIYKFIEKNESKFNDIFDRTYADINNIFSNVMKNTDTIEISGIDTAEILNKRNECHSILSHHAKEILGENSYILPYAFKINMLKDTINIIKKH